MIPLRIELTNFLAYRHPEPLELEGIHLACLTGANGAGKSSLLDAITWSLWGKARSSADDLVNQGATDMEVILEFEQGGGTYRVIRNRKAGKRGASKLLLQGSQMGDSGFEWFNMSGATIQETQERINEVVGLGHDTFVNASMLMQGQADSFTVKTPAERKQVLADILDLSAWEAYEDRVKEKIKESSKELHSVKGAMQSLEGEIATTRDAEGALVAAQGAVARFEEQLTEAESELADATIAKQEQQGLMDQSVDISKQLSIKQKELNEHKQQYDKATNQADVSAEQEELQELQIEDVDIEEYKSEMAELQKQQAEFQNTASALEGENRALMAQAEPLKKQIANLESLTDPECPTCGQALDGEHLSQTITDLQQHVEDKRDAYADNKEAIDHAKGRASDLGENIKVVQGVIATQQRNEKRIIELEARIKAATDAAERQTFHADKIVELDAQKLELTQRQAAITEKLDAANSIVIAAEDAAKKVSALRREKANADKTMGACQQRLERLKEAKIKYAEMEEQYSAMAVTVGLLEDLRDAFGKKGVPAMLIETAVPELERMTNELLGRLTDDRMNIRIDTQRETKAGDLRETLDIIISDELGSRPYELYSGGERFRINFAIRLALSKLLANRAGTRLRSLFIDEGFGSQDGQGRSQLISAINSIQEDFDRILVITHIEELKEAFPARIEVEKRADGSHFTVGV